MKIGGVRAQNHGEFERRFEYHIWVEEDALLIKINTPQFFCSRKIHIFKSQNHNFILS